MTPQRDAPEVWVELCARDAAAWGIGEGDGGRAANDLTITDWYPASKQPIFKTAAAQIRRDSAGQGPAPAPTTTASAPVGDVGFRTAGDHTALADHSIYHLGQDLAEWSRQHVREIAKIAGDYGQKLDDPKSELATARRLRSAAANYWAARASPNWRCYTT